ncbi:hypothetical protein P0M11_11185 [Kaistella sp. PBT33-4]|uniref:hypothetical protein n=1 Tax=Kaistella sp. PBT33-4 TaxID=3032000 RepID=UPI0023D83AB6|nr:hypothetical protein [Kaistella sp. PBT33-4]MDF0720561.1 hypothetical protein [Kaistella sp. PBT33-4]
MSTTFIDFQNDKGFYIHEIFMQLAMHYINQELIKPIYTLTNKQTVLDSLQLDIDGFTSGYLVLTWDNYLINSSEEQTMISVLQNVKTTLQNKGAFISVSELQAIPTQDWYFKVYYRKPFPTAELIKIIDVLIQMLQGTWTSTNYDMKINYK